MTRSRFSFSLAISLACAAIGSATVALRDAAARCYDAIAAFIAYGFALLAPEPMRLASEGYVDFDAGGEPLDPALQQDMRHEAGVPRIAAARNI